jgi:hypothetical protein
LKCGKTVKYSLKLPCCRKITFIAGCQKPRKQQDPSDDHKMKTWYYFPLFHYTASITKFAGLCQGKQIDITDGLCT